MKQLEYYQQEMEWEEELSSLYDAEDFERGYLILHNYSDKEVEYISDFTGFTFIDYVVIEGDECIIISQFPDKCWLQDDVVDQYWDGDDWINVD